MNDFAKAGLAAGVAAALLAPLPAAAQQPAPWSDDNRQSICVYDGIMAAAGRGGANQTRFDTIISGCRQRFGWTDEQARLGVLAGRAMVQVRLANSDAIDAGVAREVVNAAFATFSRDDIANLQIDGVDLADGSQEIAQRAMAQIAERGLSGNAADKAAQAVVRQLIATRILAEFTVELRR